MAGIAASRPHTGHRCPVCGGRVSGHFFEIENVTVHVNVLHRSAGAARDATRGDLRMGLCRGCGFIWNVAFDPELVAYDGDYDNSLHHSSAFETYAAALADRLVARYDLHGRHIVELGCGQADFLRRICDAGGSRGTGFDPSYVGPERDGAVTVHPVYYTEDTVGDEPADFVLCRHVLEHIEQPLDLLRSLRNTLDPARGTPVYFEVPNGEYQLEHGVVWDLIYAHVGTFTAPALQTLFERAGFEVLDVGTSFGDQYLWIEARPAVEQAVTPQRDAVRRVRAVAERFAAGYRDSVAGWRRQIDGFTAAGQRVVLWGAGAKGVMLLNALGPDRALEGAVDMNPRKHGSFLAGSATPVVAPESLSEVVPDIVVLANPIYAAEVRGILARIGQDADVVCV